MNYNFYMGSVMSSLGPLNVFFEDFVLLSLHVLELDSDVYPGYFAKSFVVAFTPSSLCVDLYFWLTLKSKLHIYMSYGIVTWVYKENKCKNMYSNLVHTYFFINSCLRFHILHWRVTPWSEVFLENLIFMQLVKKFPALNGTQRLITVFTRALQYREFVTFLN